MQIEVGSMTPIILGGIGIATALIKYIVSTFDKKVDRVIDVVEDMKDKMTKIEISVNVLAAHQERLNDDVKLVKTDGCLKKVK